MFRYWLTPLPAAVLALFLLGFPCRSMMLYMQAPEEPAHHCCGDCDESAKAPSQGCHTLCVASGARIVLHSVGDSLAGAPADCGPIDPVAPNPWIPAGPVVESTVPATLGSPPLYLRHSSLLI
jgi:hypothetical protein